MSEPNQNIENEKTSIWKKSWIWGGISMFLSITTLIWEAYLLPEYLRLSAAGRLNEGDSEGCMVGFLMLPTIFLVPVVSLIAAILAAIGIRWQPRWFPIVALLLSLIGGCLVLVIFLPALQK